MNLRKKVKTNCINYGVSMRLYPTQRQKALIKKHFAAVRSVWNFHLNQRQELWEAARYTINYYEQCKDLTVEKTTEEHKWWNEVSSKALQSALQNLDNAFVRFFKRQANFPRFKHKGEKKAFSSPNYLNGNKMVIRIEGNKIIFQKFKEGIKFRSGKIPENIKSITVYEKNGKIYASCICEGNKPKIIPTGKAIGIDLGIKNLVACSDGTIYDKYKIDKKKEKKLKRYQRIMARRQPAKEAKASNRYNAIKLKYGKLMAKIVSGRKDHIHKITSEIVKNNDVICMENLKVKEMQKKPTLKKFHLTKHLANASFHEVRRQIEYKAKWHSKEIKFVDVDFSSSKICHECGYINNDLKLRQRNWVCPNCNAKLHRDVNASINILNECLNFNTAGNAEIKGRGVLEQANGQPLGSNETMSRQLASARVHNCENFKREG